MIPAYVNGPNCAGCAFQPQGTIFIPPDGSGVNGVYLVGDSGWIQEAATRRFHEYKPGFSQEVGTPFSGASGFFLDKTFKRIGVQRRDFRIGNNFWCKAPKLGMTDNLDKYPEAAAAFQHCRPYLRDDILKTAPKVLVPMGGAALFGVTGLHGIMENHAYVIPSIFTGIPAIPAFHPSFIIQGNQKFEGAFAFVLRKALAIARGELDPHPNYNLLLDPSPALAMQYLSGPLDELVCDIETNMTPGLAEDEREAADWQIVRISFSVGGKSAISFPFCAPYIDIARDALARAKSVIFWNQAFDAPRLAAAGCPVRGRIQDAMWAWHWLQSDLPKALGFTTPLLIPASPWKHLSSEKPAYYSALDSAYTWDNFNAIRDALKSEGRWNEFDQRQCTPMIPILKGATDAGILLDTKAQGELIDVKLVSERDAYFKKIQSQVPQSVRPVKIYKRFAPKNLDKLLAEGHEWQSHEVGKGGVLYKPFNPSSSKQRIALFRALDIKVPYNGREDKEGVEQKHLRKYAKKFPVLMDIIEFSSREKLITAYDWPPEPDGRVHAEFGFNPSTWRKNARNPNIQTIPKRNELAQLFRRLFIAAPGCVLLESDSSAIEAVLVGYFAGSQRYIALAKRGVHKWLAAEIAGRPVSKEEPLYDKAKRIVHLSNYMGTPERIFEEYPDDFASVKEARKIQEFYLGTPEGMDIRSWHAQTLSIAAHDNRLDTPFLQRHYFYDVLSMQDGKVRLGSDAKRAIAFKPQASASAIQTIFVLALPEWIRSAYLRAIIHDSIVLEVPEELAKEVAGILHYTMTRPIAELGGLDIGAETKIGKNLGSYDANSNPEGMKTWK